MQELKQYIKNIEESLQENTADEIIESVLEETYLVNHENEMKGVRLALTLGGPNVYLEIDGGAEYLVGFWGGNHHMERIDLGEKANEIFEAFDLMRY